MSELTAATGRPRVVLQLADGIGAAPSSAPWIGGLLSLGTRLSRRLNSFAGQQVVVVLTVPSREYAALLVGCGWALARQPRRAMSDPISALCTPGAVGKNFRAVTATHVISGTLLGVDMSRNPVRVTLAGHWAADKFDAVAEVDEPDAAERMERPVPGSVSIMAGLDKYWPLRLAAPAADLAIIGTRAWLVDEMEALLSREGEADADQLAALLLPKSEQAATWSTRVYSSASLMEHLPLPEDLRLVILDGSQAISYVSAVISDLVVCVVDRSATDDSAARQLLQLRNSRGAPVSLRADLGWRAPAGVESFAFSMAL